jgi:hypothetical protein
MCVHRMVSEVLTHYWGSTPVSLCWSTERTLDYSKPNFNKWSLLYPVGYIVDCYELVGYRRQWLIVGSSLLIMLTMVLVIGI